MTTTDRSEAKQIALTILAQLGGNRFLAMTGASSLAYNQNDLSFRISPRMAKGIQMVRITLEPMDTYKVEFIKARNLKIVTVAEFSGVYADQLQSIFTATTGLDTHL